MWRIQDRRDQNFGSPNVRNNEPMNEVRNFSETSDNQE
jgi:hypothetical protein